MIASRRFCRPWWKVQWCLVMVSNAKQPEIQTRLHLNARNTDDRQREDYPGKEITENIQELPWTNSWVGASICCGIASKSFIEETVRTFCYCSSKINTRMLPQILGSRWCIGTSSTCSKDYKSCERLKLPSIWFLRKKKRHNLIPLIHVNSILHGVKQQKTFAGKSAINKHFSGWVINFCNLFCSITYLFYTMCYCPGQENPWHHLESSQNNRRGNNAWKIFCN